MTKEQKDLIGVIFDSTGGAAAALASMHDLESGAYVHIEDTAVVVKDADGKTHVNNEVSRGAKRAGLLGGGGGLLAGFLLGGPIGGLAVGLIGGGLAARLGHMGIDKEFIKQVETDMAPGSSALFLLSRADSRDMIIASMAPFEGTIYHTNLPPEAEAQLAEYLE